jgi:hypothetical protein
MNSTTPSFLVNEDGTVPSLTKTSTNTLKVGDILHSATGYEASISEFHKVVKVSGKNVWLVELPVNRKYQNGGMDWEASPDLQSSVDGPTIRRLVKDGNRVKIDSYRTAWKWSGEVAHDYNYH